MLPCLAAESLLQTPPPRQHRWVFSETAPLNRAQFANILFRTLGEATPFVSEFPFFRDVPNTYWAYRAIETLREKGIMSGFPGGFYRPRQPMRKLETFLIFSHVLRNVVLPPQEVEKLLQPISNQASLSGEAREAVAKLVATEVLTVSATQPQPIDFQGPISRQELRTLLEKLQAKLNLVQPLSPELNPEAFLPAGISLSITPINALQADKLAIGNKVYFMTTKAVLLPPDAIGNAVELPKGSRLSGTVDALQPGPVYQIQFHQIQIPSGEIVAMGGVLPLTFPEASGSSFIVPGQVFQLATTLVNTP